MTDTTPDVVYRYTGTGFRRGVPRRDLTARDAARLGPAILRDVVGGARPMYEAVDPRTAPVVPPPPPDLRAMKRGDLNEHAAGVGVADPAAYPTKDDLIAAIEAAGGADATEPAGPPKE